MVPTRREVSILITSGNVLACELYAQALSQHSYFQVVGRVATVDDAVRAVESMAVSIALISTTLQDGPLSGLAALRRIYRANAEVKPIMLFEASEANLMVSAFRNGARGVFCPAEDGFGMLCRCVEQVHAGQIWAKSAQLREVLAAFSRRAPVQIVNSHGVRLLTPREEDIVRLVEEGLTNRQIAQELKLSEYTVRNNLFRIFEKLGVSTRVELTLYALNNLVPAAEKNDGGPARAAALSLRKRPAASCGIGLAFRAQP